MRFDHHAFPLELVNERPTPKRLLDAEISALADLEPEAGWQPWQGDDWTYPVTTLPALEAVQAAKEQSPEASEALDLALRRALFAESRCISLRSVILEVAAENDGVDADALAEALDEGRARRAVMDDFAEAKGDTVQGSPHLFLPGGKDVHNPGIEMHWEGEKEEGALVVEWDRPDVYADLLREASAR